MESKNLMTWGRCSWTHVIRIHLKYLKNCYRLSVGQSENIEPLWAANIRGNCPHLQTHSAETLQNFHKNTVRVLSKLPLRCSPGEGTVCWKSTPLLGSFSATSPRIKGLQLLKKGNKPCLPSPKALLKPTVAKGLEQKNNSLPLKEEQEQCWPRRQKLFSSQVSNNIMRSHSYDAVPSTCLKLNLNQNNREYATTTTHTHTPTCNQR